MKYAKKDEVNILMGDLSAKVGNDPEYPTAGKYGLGERNERGGRLIEFCKGKNLVMTNAFFQHHSRNIYTWKDPGDLTRNQVDFIIIINERYRNVVTSVKTYPGADIGSDHIPVIAQLRIKLKKINKRTSHEKFEILFLQYNVEIRNKLATLNIEEIWQIEEMWKNIKPAMNDAVKKTAKKEKRQENVDGRGNCQHHG